LGCSGLEWTFGKHASGPGPLKVPTDQLASMLGIIAAGAERYAALCVGCHLAPGVTKSEIRSGLYPHPPNLAQEDLRDGRRAFWIIKHGIKMSAMPSWGKTLDDAAIWDVVSFVRKMPDMSPETYQLLSRSHQGETAQISRRER
jgi:mono/diheme cytochrome c family protein